jgi:hypothetical protein
LGSKMLVKEHRTWQKQFGIHFGIHFGSCPQSLQF